MRDNAPDDGESRCNTSMPLVVEASRSITSPAPVPQAKRHLFPVLASQQAQRISALVRYDAVGAEEDEEAAMHRTRTILPLPLLSWLTVASWRLLTRMRRMTYVCVRAFACTKRMARLCRW